jgi:ubiquinone/menaquinone biosynthesis C-methylase UbiE
VPLDSDEYVREQYRTTKNLDTRISVWRADTIGNSPQEVALDAVSEVQPRHVLEVGSGRGSLAKRIVGELRCEIVALDASPAMVAASAAIGIVTLLGDVRNLPFRDDSFDVVVAAWMLYHVFPLDQALAELARVLRPGGRLVAVTNGREHLAELWNAVGAIHDEPSFSVENGAEHLRAHFSRVERIDTTTHAIFEDRTSAAAYLDSVDRGDLVERLEHTKWPLRAKGATAVFVAEKSA